MINILNKIKSLFRRDKIKIGNWVIKDDNGVLIITDGDTLLQFEGNKIISTKDIHAPNFYVSD